VVLACDKCRGEYKMCIVEGGVEDTSESISEKIFGKLTLQLMPRLFVGQAKTE
jgi:hypothetical protein